MSEPTSVLAFSDLMLKVANKLGLAYYGANGDQAAQLPIDPHDLDLVQRLVNDAIRMFIHDGPQPNGWRWLRPVASVVIWPTVAVSASNAITTAVYDGVSKTTITVPTAAFYPSMELKPMVITTIGTFTISDYVSATVVKVTGDAHLGATKTWSITADGNYTLPQTFGGQHLGSIYYASSTNRGVFPEWCDESAIRAWRQNMSANTGTPWKIAIRLMSTGTPRRRWELMTYPFPGELFTLEFPYQLHFDALVNNTDVPPSPFSHDETVKAACFALAEKEKNDATGIDWDYYTNRCLPNSYRIDAASAPRKIHGIRGPRNLRDFRDNYYKRPTVTFNG